MASCVPAVSTAARSPARAMKEGGNNAADVFAAAYPQTKKKLWKRWESEDWTQESFPKDVVLSGSGVPGGACFGTVLSAAQVGPAPWDLRIWLDNSESIDRKGAELQSIEVRMLDDPNASPLRGSVGPAAPATLRALVASAIGTIAEFMAQRQSHAIRADR